MASLVEMMETRTDREKLLEMTARFMALTEVGTLIFNELQSKTITADAAERLQGIKEKIETITDEMSPEMRELTWSEWQKEPK